MKKALIALVLLFPNPVLLGKHKKSKHKKNSPTQRIPETTANIHAVTKRHSAVTYTFSGGRFGDNLVAYLHAKWISYTFDIPLLYKPFPYSDQLMMHELEQHYQDADYETFEHHKTLQKGDSLDFTADSSTLYIIPYFGECLQEHQRPGYRLPYFAVDWNNQEFLKEIRKTIQPKNPITCLPLPQDKITVAVHIRKRTPGFDRPVLFEQETTPASLDGYADRWWPFKFANDEYYQEQIRRVSTFFEHQPLYVYLFTDAPNPIELVQQYKEALQLPNLEFDCRKTINRHDINVLEDFFALTQFDCLIRVESNFSVAASKLANFKVQVTPTRYHYHPTRGYPVIDKVMFTIAK